MLQKLPMGWVKNNCMNCDKPNLDHAWVPTEGYIFVPCDQILVCTRYLKDFRTHLFDRLANGETQGPVPTEKDPCRWLGLCGLMTEACTDTSLWGSDVCLYDKDGFEIIEED